MINTAIFLAKQWRDTDELYMRMLAETDPVKMRDMLIMEWPIVQGMRQQMALRKLADLPLTPGTVGKEIDAALADKPA